MNNLKTGTVKIFKNIENHFDFIKSELSKQKIELVKIEEIIVNDNPCGGCMSKCNQEVISYKVYYNE